MAQLTEEPVVDVMQKLQNSPEAMVAVTKFLQVAQIEGRVFLILSLCKKNPEAS